jgi:hypothetical protein
MTSSDTHYSRIGGIEMLTTVFFHLLEKEGSKFRGAFESGLRLALGRDPSS